MNRGKECPRCGAPWTPSKEDEARCAVCYGQTAIPPEWPEEDPEEEQLLIERKEP